MNRIAKSALALVTCIAGSSSFLIVGCGSDPSSASNGAVDEGNSGSLGFALTVPGNSILNSVTYTIVGPANYTSTGTINVSNSTTISTLLSLPAGGPYSVTLSGTSTDNSVSCSGSAQTSITAGQSKTLTVQMTCHEAGRTGSVAINGTLNSCPVIDSLGASPAEVLVGGTIALSSSATTAMLRRLPSATSGPRAPAH